MEQFEDAMQLVNSMALPMVLHTSVQLGVLEVIFEAGPDAQLSPSEIVERLGFPNPDAPAMLDRMFRLLASYSLLTCSLDSTNQESSISHPRRIFGLTSLGKHFVNNRGQGSLGSLLALVQDKVYLESWLKLKDAVIGGGIPFELALGVKPFEYPEKDPRYNEIFNSAMINHTTTVMNGILHIYQGFKQVNKMVDVGGGLGITLSLITSKYPNIKGVNFDLPHVIQNAPPYPGVEHVGGDMFESVPPVDTIFMKWILHNWSDESCLKLLKNCYKALPDNGKVIVVEEILPVVPETSSKVKSTSQIDVIMMTQIAEGRERSHDEFLGLAKEAGFSGIKLDCCVCNFWVMEFYK